MDLKAFLLNVPPPNGADAPTAPSRDDQRSETSSFFEDAKDFQDAPQKPFYATKPSPSEMFWQGFASLRPKTKLFPRPVTSDKPQQPQTAHAARQKLPQGIRTKPQSSETERPKSQKSHKSHMRKSSDNPRRPSTRATSAKPDEEVPPLPKNIPLPQATTGNSTQAATQGSPSSRHDVPQACREQGKSTTPKDEPLARNKGVSQDDAQPSSAKTKERLFSPEKERLMRAMQLRKKQREETQPAENTSHEHKKEPASTANDKVPELKTDSGVDMEVGPEERANSSTNDESQISKTKDDDRDQENGRPSIPRIELPLEDNEHPIPSWGDQAQGMDDNVATPDEGLLDELQSARVEQAKSLVISQNSPKVLSSISLRKGSVAESPSATPTQRGFSVTDQTTAQSSTPKRGHQSHGMSRQIQALAEMSNREHAADGYAASVPSPSHSNSFLAGRRSIDQSRPASGARYPASSSRPSSPTKSLARNASFDSQRSGTTAFSRTSRSQRKGKTMSITTPIVRDESKGPPQRPNAIEEETGDPDQSPPTLSRRLPIRINSSSKRDHQTYGAKGGPASRPSSRESALTSQTRPSTDASRPTMRRRDTARKKLTSFSNTSLDRVDEASERSSTIRSSKLFKRFSRFTGGLLDSASSKSSGGKSGFSKTDPQSAQPKAANNLTKPASVTVGDLNVQFPDTLVSKSTQEICILELTVAFIALETQVG